MMKKHNYPKTRKKYIPTNSQKYQLLQKHSLEEIRAAFFKGGMYVTGEKFGVSPKVIYDIAIQHGFKRPLPSHLKSAVKIQCWKVGRCHFID
jgi:hypothetical protein